MGAGQFRIEILSGLTVALALVPEAIAFAFVAGVAPLVGLYAAFIVGLITAVFGGRPAMISGATGAGSSHGFIGSPARCRISVCRGCTNGCNPDLSGNI